MHALWTNKRTHDVARATRNIHSSDPTRNATQPAVLGRLRWWLPRLRLPPLLQCGRTDGWCGAGGGGGGGEFVQDTKSLRLYYDPDTPATHYHVRSARAKGDDRPVCDSTTCDTKAAGGKKVWRTPKAPETL